MDGVTRTTVVSGLSHPWGLTIHQDHLYYTDVDYEVIERVDKDTGANMVVMRSGMSDLRALKVHARDSMWIQFFFKKFNPEVIVIELKQVNNLLFLFGCFVRFSSCIAVIWAQRIQ